jgi:hypothetical protein
MSTRIALVTCSTLPDLDADDQPVRDGLRSRGIDAVAAVWDDPGVDWAAFDLCVIRSAWDYAPRRDEFVAWARSVPSLANPADIIEWNTDKHYLADLAAAGLPIVPTSWLESEPIVLPAAGAHVLKPAVGAGSIDAARFALEVEHEAALARQHAGRLIASGRSVMVQPYVSEIDAAGETALMYFRGVFSHAVKKRAMLAARREMVDGLYYEETIAPYTPTAAELSVGAAAVSAIPGGTDPPLYARVDLVPSATGEPLLMELELTEPSLFLRFGEGAADHLAEAIAFLG